MSLVSVFYVVLLLAATLLCVALIIYLNRITRSIREMQSDIKDLTYEVKPLIASASDLSNKLSDLSDDVKEPVDIAKGIAIDVRERVDKILELEEKVRKGVEKPATQLINQLSAIVNGVNTFWNAYTKR
ncbi:MAG: hypothetical protein ABI550_04190 [Ignavibacteriaceae bacterium]